MPDAVVILLSCDMGMTGVDDDFDLEESMSFLAFCHFKNGSYYTTFPRHKTEAGAKTAAVPHEASTYSCIEKEHANCLYPRENRPTSRRCPQ